MTTKTINIYAYGLHGDTTVMLMFQPLNTPMLFHSQFPVVWRVLTFPAKGHSKAVIRYTSRLAFGYAQTDRGSHIESASWTQVKSGDITSITGGDYAKQFGRITRGHSSKSLVCKNNTDRRANLSIGFVQGDGIDQRYEPTLVWTGVASKSCVSTQFTPILMAYVARDYEATQILRCEVGTDAIWTCNLNKIGDVTGWNFMEDSSTGAFVIEPAKHA